MTNSAEQLRTISSQVQADEIARQEAMKALRETEKETRISQKIDKIHHRALEQAKKGETWLEISRLDPKRYSEFWGTGKLDIKPEALHDDDRIVAEILKKEGFEIFIGFVDPSYDGGDAPPESIYNYLGITWRDGGERSKV